MKGERGDTFGLDGERGKKTVSEVKTADGRRGLLVAALVIIHHPALTQCLISILITNISPHNKEII